MFIVGIYGLQSVWWDLRTWWDTGMGLGETRIALMGRHRGVLCVQNRQQNNTGKQEMPVGVVLTDGHMGHKQGPLKPNKNTQKKKKEGAEGASRNECEENATDRPANIHTTTHQFCI